MKIDKGFGELMLSCIGSKFANNSLTNKSSIVLSLWSGSELTDVERSAILASIPSSGNLIPGNWTANFAGRTELARLVLTDFADRSEGVDLSVIFSIAKASKAFSVLSAGTAGAFTMFFCNNTFNGYTNVVGNRGKILLSGSVSNLDGSGDLRLSSTAIALTSIVHTPSIVIDISYLNFENSWLFHNGLDSAGPLLNTTDISTTGWTKFADWANGFTVSEPIWNSLVANLKTGVKLIDSAGRVAYMSKAKLISANVKNINQYVYSNVKGTGAATYIIHNEDSGTGAAGSDYTLLSVTNTGGMVWNLSVGMRWDYLDAGFAMPADCYIH